MEFEYSGTIYFDVDKIWEECRERNLTDVDEIRHAVLNYTADFDGVSYYLVEGWMIDAVTTEIKKRVDKELNA